MIKALVGYTGYVGSSHNLNDYDFLINSSNINNYSGVNVDLMVVAAGDARKWYANQNPDKDWEHMLNLYRSIIAINAKHVILYSTVDVLDTSLGIADEDSTHYNNHPYGRNRLLFELLISKHFKKVQIIRLPGLFGKGLKKNIVFDIKNNRHDQYNSYNPLSEFQFFNMKHSDILIENVIKSKRPLVHVTSDRISVLELFSILAPEHIGFLNENCKIVYYNLRTKFTGINPGLVIKTTIINEIMEYINDATC